MARALVTVRDATPSDLPELLGLWTHLRTATPRSDLAAAPRSDRAATARQAPDLLARLHEAADDPDSRIVVAVHDGVLAGVAVLVAAPLAPLVVDTPCVHIYHLQVREGLRRRGVGRALVAGALAFAEEVGAQHVVASVPPNLRDANRFYARLGLGPLVVRRATTVAALRRRLLADNRYGLAGVVARRRSLRIRALAGS